MVSKIAAVITAYTGDHVVVTEERINHILPRFAFSPSNVLEYLKLILTDPSDIFLDLSALPIEYLLFYRKEIAGYFVAVVKKKGEAAFIRTMHRTGKKIRNKHIRMKRVK